MLLSLPVDCEFLEGPLGSLQSCSATITLLGRNWDKGRAFEAWGTGCPSSSQGALWGMYVWLSSPGNISSNVYGFLKLG